MLLALPTAPVAATASPPPASPPAVPPPWPPFSDHHYGFSTPYLSSLPDYYFPPLTRMPACSPYVTNRSACPDADMRALTSTWDSRIQLENRCDAFAPGDPIPAAANICDGPSMGDTCSAPCKAVNAGELVYAYQFPRYATSNSGYNGADTVRARPLSI